MTVHAVLVDVGPRIRVGSHLEEELGDLRYGWSGSLRRTGGIVEHGAVVEGKAKASREVVASAVHLGQPTDERLATDLRPTSQPGVEGRTNPFDRVRLQRGEDFVVAGSLPTARFHGAITRLVSQLCPTDRTSTRLAASVREEIDARGRFTPPTSRSFDGPGERQGLG